MDTRFMSTAASPHRSDLPAIVVMGVAGSGKSTIGKAIADELQAAFLEGDAFHPPANIAKMSAGIPLDDADRWPWLAAVGTEIGMIAASGRPVVAACSALKRRYRDALRMAAGRQLVFVMLEGSRGLIARRMSERPGHFMPASLLDSQFAAFEPLQADEVAVLVDLDQPIQAMLTQAITGLGQLRT